MQNLTRRRAVLVAPGSDERKAVKALRSTADEVVLDLEDAVASARKADARDLVRRLVRESDGSRAVSVRINALTTPWAEDDLALCASLGDALTSIVVPKVETAQDLAHADRALAGTDIGLQALVETPVGVQNIGDITRAVARLESVVIGYADLGAALGRSRSALPEHWLAIQDGVLVAARAAGIQAIDGPFLGIADDDAFRHSAAWTSALGFDGKWVIHPAQVDSAASAFTPTDSAVEDARRVIDALAAAEAAGSGAAQLDGQMLDEAVAVAARRVLAQVGAQ
ncbi:HpcH/HpaI aldolase/citrate lyase family protein [Rhodococcus wratislaviensis]|uniref:Putative citrate lyase beta chain n=1 Tax=Rhodococcus wratislaviensis NBRC 100605 TaxID=1219028 RepID=X0Q3E8_RHOWR|nr:CoA ester lyase [Rhodococcus wratislaviensis]GAF44916.1 putative citrate lyase beta chain [Rhodococcus wratislaviensis NBRC 100605]